jgi:hypothetical protein
MAYPMTEDREQIAPPAFTRFHDGEFDAPSELARALFAAIDARELAAFASHIHNDYTFHIFDHPPVDFDGHLAFDEQAHAMMPGITHRIDQIISDGISAAVRLTVISLAGEITAMAMLRTRDRQITEYRLLFDGRVLG